MLLFLNYQTYVVTTENKATKAQGGKRVMHTTHHPCWDAKNRHGLADALDLDFTQIGHVFGKVAPINTETPIQMVRRLMAEAEVTEEELRRVVAAKSRYSETTPLEEYPENFLTGWVLKYWDQIINIIAASRVAE